MKNKRNKKTNNENIESDTEMEATSDSNINGPYWVLSFLEEFYFKFFSKMRSIKIEIAYFFLKRRCSIRELTKDEFENLFFILNKITAIQGEWLELDDNMLLNKPTDLYKMLLKRRTILVGSDLNTGKNFSLLSILHELFNHPINNSSFLTCLNSLSSFQIMLMLYNMRLKNNKEHLGTLKYNELLISVSKIKLKGISLNFFGSHS